MNKSINTIIQEAGLSSNDNHYMFPFLREEGLGDIKAENLEAIYQGIRTSWGEEESKGYINIMAGLIAEAPDLNAPLLINALQDMYHAGYQYSKEFLSYSMRHVYSENKRKELMAQPVDIPANIQKRRRLVQEFLVNHAVEMSEERRLQFGLRA